MTSEPQLAASGIGLSHVGRIRKRNEDTMHIDAEGRFALVADGMGGHHGGQEASRMTCEAMRTALNSQYDTLALWSDDDVLQFLKSSFQRISSEVFDTGARNPALANMGTTLVSWLMQKERVFIAHVGDSRAYLIRDRKIFQMTVDHTFVNEQICLGARRSQLPPFTLPHAIFRNIGMSPPSDPATLTAKTQEGDLWLLCSDGLSGKVPPQEMLSTVNHEMAGKHEEENLANICKTLVKSAIEHGGEDNITVVLMQIHSR